MIDRCQSVNLEHYSAENIKTILKQYNDQLYRLNISEEDYDLLSVNTRYTPRIAINYFDDFAVCKDIKKVLSAHQVIKNSLTTNDVIVLEHLAEINKPIGVEVLSIITQQTKQDYMTLQEPFLIMEKYISRMSRGRIITDKGKLFLQEIK
jgi:Holliday junction resolvasome RuvABC ATP-dependent DNA helicase subunit